MTQMLGWVATAVFCASYFFKQPAALRATQMGGAVLWIVYGFMIAATPVIAANFLVFAAAAWTAFTTTRSKTTAEPEASGGSRGVYTPI